MLLDSPATDFPLFAPPREPVSLADYAAGLHAASIVPDGGTLQIGIGSLGEAVAQALVLRQRHNAEFRTLLSRLGYDPARDTAVHTEPFDLGLYGCTELFVEGMLDLYRAGILKREVDGVVLHAGFFIGSRAFYRALREMPREVVQKFGMTSISFVNELYRDEDNKRRARTNARFLNDAMMATRSATWSPTVSRTAASSAASAANTISSPRVLRLTARARRSCCVRRARRRAGTESNIRWRYGHTTIPRHLRDMIMTEYGIADIRGKSDREVIAAMLAITDSRFQDELLRQAKDAGKIERAFELPKVGARQHAGSDRARAASRPPMRACCRHFRSAPISPTVEQRLIPALQTLKSASPARARCLAHARALSGSAGDNGLPRPARLGAAANVSEWFYAALVRGALQ